MAAERIPLPWQGSQWAGLVALADSGRLPHALLLAGPSGTGKTAFAARLAELVLCAESGAQPCGTCRHCRLAAAGSHPDLMTVRPEEPGKAILIDCHSMPANVRVAGGSRRPDIIIGDRYGASAAHDLSRAAVSFLSGLGYHVVRNKPYAGGFITEHYGRPGRGLHALQIEINRGLYVNEATLEKKTGFDLLKADLAEFAGEMMGYVREGMAEDQLAAE